MAQPGLEYRPKDTDRAHVRALAMCGRTHDDIALSLGIHADTLQAHFVEELKVNTMFLEATASGKMMDLLKSDDENIVHKAASFLLRMKCKWKEDKSVDDAIQRGAFDAFIMTAHANLLAKKEKEHDC